MRMVGQRADRGMSSMADGTTVAVVLAAGEGTRFEGAAHKLVSAFRGRPVVVWAVEAAIASGLATVVVEGAVGLATTLDDAGLRDHVTLVRNERWVQGQAGSLTRGVEAAGTAGADAVVVGLGDQPMVEAEAWRLVAASDRTFPIAVATYDGERRNPVRLDRAVWDLLPSEGDEGARSLIRRRPDLVMEVPCPGQPADIDTVEDLRRWS
jgi:CTP:molybdopterin cytidylyltransferase MocA